MGYNTRFDGKIKITPIMSALDLGDIETVDPQANGDSSLGQNQWIIVQYDDGHYLEHDQCEKFYDYVEWMEWLVKHIFEPRGYVLNGEIAWCGESHGDYGKIIVVNNSVYMARGAIAYAARTEIYVAKP